MVASGGGGGGGRLSRPADILLPLVGVFAEGVLLLLGGAGGGWLGLIFPTRVGVPPGNNKVLYFVKYCNPRVKILIFHKI